MLHSIRQQSEPGHEARRSILTGRVFASQGTTGIGFLLPSALSTGLASTQARLADWHELFFLIRPGRHAALLA